MSSRAEPSRIPITFTLPQASYVTVVIDDATTGKRIRNLIAETQLPAGKNTIYWDGYDEGSKNDSGDLVRHRVPPGTYIAHGLTHTGIHMMYEFGVNSPGIPPWFTDDHTGAWMADHSPPLGVVFLPQGSGSPYGNGQPQMMLCSKAAESGDPIIWTTLSGRKLYGTKVFGWGGGLGIAHDAGPNARPDVLAYLLDAEHHTASIRVITKDGQGNNLIDLPAQTEIPFDNGHAGNSIAAYNGILAVSMPLDNVIDFVDSRTGKMISQVNIDNPKGLYFAADGSLLVVSDTKIMEGTVTVSGQSVTLSGLHAIVSTGLEDPQELVQTLNGKIYVTDWGTSHQVKVFSATGTPLITIGHPGGPAAGYYDYYRMHFPKGIAVDNLGQIWVTDADYAPKRVSVWKQDGTLAAAIIGGPMYGGGGMLDPMDPTRFYYHVNDITMEFHLDWATGTYYLRSIPVRPDVQDADHMPGGAPERAIYIDNRQYMVADNNPGLRANGGESIWLMDNKTGIAWPVAVVQGAHSLGPQHGWLIANTDVTSQWPSNPSGAVAIWSDLNGDHRVEPNEIKFIYPPGSEYFNVPTYTDDLAVTFDNGALHLNAPTFLPNGVPVYDGSTAHYLLPGIDMSPDSPQKVLLKDGRVLVMPASCYKDGQLLWSYPWYDENTIPQHPGQMADPTRLMGKPINVGDAGIMYAMNGDKGAMFLMTADGLYVQTLGGDLRTHPLLRLPTAVRGEYIDGYSFGAEDFGPTITQETDGSVYVVSGHEFTALFKLVGLDTIHRHVFQNIALTSTDLASLPDTETEVSRKQLQQTLSVPILASALTVDGNLANWPASAQWATIDDRASASVAVNSTNLYAAWRTDQPNLLTNDGGDYRFLFKHGGALDIMLATDPNADSGRRDAAAGDLRLLITRVNGATKAVVYRQVDSSAQPADGQLYSSPVGQVNFDRVTDVSSYVHLAQNGSNYEISVPLNVLGLTPTSGTSTFGDIGILRGSGVTTIQRVYWNNLQTSIVSDIPSEARLQPGNWGIFQFH